MVKLTNKTKCAIEMHVLSASLWKMNNFRELLFCIFNFSICLKNWNPLKGLYLKSFWLRDRGILGNKGRPISLKIGTQSHHVDFCNIPKFQAQRPFFSRVLDISYTGAPRGWFSVQFCPLFKLSFRNVQLILDKTETIFVKPYPSTLMGENISLREFLVSL